MTLRIAAVTAVLAVSAVALAACGKPTLEAPLDTGVCYHVGTKTDGTHQFNVVARNMPNIENCAAQLEGMRLRFLRMGGQTREMAGAYQGSFIMLRRDGIYRAQKWGGTEYLMLVRSGDGRLIMPGAVQ
ncbi:hypothetical protein [Caulobacter mirabilis]|uniref:Lipoprotein n=1 Tax=Caulobacter mirabilis TaxID=69666 RepID=A0A2D2AZM0_9CAUL|nr:hypothetical protein [Caulobacter mirabilis]ATQ43446.1 hypothetical protein CSW64_14015 [Caulobacter mirabilis]